MALKFKGPGSVFEFAKVSNHRKQLEKETRASPVPAVASITLSSEVQFDGPVTMVTVCDNTSGFFSDNSGRIVPSHSADCVAALSKTCIYARIHGNDYLTVVSAVGGQKFQCRCDIAEWRYIFAIHCDSERQLLFIGQPDALTVTDLSGARIRCIESTAIDHLQSIEGIGGSSAFLFATSGNKIFAISKTTGKLKEVVALKRLKFPNDAELSCVGFRNDSIVVFDDVHRQLHSVQLDDKLNPMAPCSSLEPKFSSSIEFTLDDEGRIFVSESNTNSLKVLSAKDGSLLCQLTRVQSANSADVAEFKRPLGLALVTIDEQQQLVVADCDNHRLLLLNID